VLPGAVADHRLHSEARPFDYAFCGAKFDGVLDALLKRKEPVTEAGYGCALKGFCVHAGPKPGQKKKAVKLAQRLVADPREDASVREESLQGIAICDLKLAKAISKKLLKDEALKSRAEDVLAQQEDK
jgi:hypothetical protein